MSEGHRMPWWERPEGYDPNELVTTRVQVTLASAAQAGNPRYWQEIAAELQRCLPDPFAHRRNPRGG